MTVSRPTRHQIAETFLSALPHAGELGLALVSVGEGAASLEMPWDEGLVGDPTTGVIHGGAVSALIDTTCGTAVLAHPENAGDTATLNMRIDYMRAAQPGQTIVARATCFHVTHTVAFVRAEAVDDDTDAPVATAAAAFTFKRAERG